MEEQISLFEQPEKRTPHKKSKTYEEFTEKFVRKKTTDDCYTPPAVYDAVRDWAVGKYKLQGRPIIRPFYPDKDYKTEEYPENCVVLDNPPFSCITQICKYYDAVGIDYFLFAPALTLFGVNRGKDNYIIAGVRITYENGATVPTDFVTNLGDDKIIVTPELKVTIDAIQKEANPFPTYRYPDTVVTAARLRKIAIGGIELRISKSEAVWITALDEQRVYGKALFGNGFLISEKAAAEKAAAEKAAAEKAAAEKAAAEKAAAERAHAWTLSEREKAIIKGM